MRSNRVLGTSVPSIPTTLGNARHNLNVCQHKWRELKPKLDRFNVCFDRVPTGDLSHDDQVEARREF
ncbi:hypothetical protein Hanom_Chr05g00425601 [Helianthus anomalus]